MQQGAYNAEFNLKLLVSPVPFLGMEGAVQQDYAVIPLIEARMNDATNVMMDAMATSLYTNTSDTQQFTGLPLAVDSSGTYGNISRSAYSWWASKEYAAGSVNPTRQNVLQYISGTVKNCAEVPTFGVCGFGTWTLLAQDYVGQEQYMITPGSGFDGDANGPQAAFRALMVAGVPIYPDPYCPEGNLYLLNTNYLSLYIHGIMFVASGAYVNLSQATLIDRDPRRAENTMVRWVLMGAIGVTISPVIITLVLSVEGSWRAVYLSTAIAPGLFAVLLFKQRFNGHDGAGAGADSLKQLGRSLLTALRSRKLIKWVILTELADFMLDKLLEVTGLYFHDVAGVSLSAASAAVTIATIAGLIGNFALVPLLEKVNGVRMLRLSALVALIAYAALLLIPVVWLKYVLIAVINLSTAGWYAVLRAKLRSTRKCSA